MSKLRINARVGRFFGAGEVFSGPGSLAVLAGLSANRVSVIVSGSFWRDTSNKARLEKALKKFDVQYLESAGGEPIFSRAADLSNCLRSHNPQVIIGIGGGSTLDYAKLAWMLYEHPDLHASDLRRPFSAPKLGGRASLIAIPTTAGTGSEASSAAVFQERSGSHKSFVVTHDFLPQIAILDENLLASCPRSIKLSAGLDALSHAIEGYTSVFGNEQICDLAEMAARCLFRSLGKFVESDDAVEAGVVLRAAHWAGIVQNIAVPGIGHAFAHQMSKVGVGHGQACGFFLPMAMRVNLDDKVARSALNRLAFNLGFGDEHGLLTAVEHLNKSLGNTIDKFELEKVFLSPGFGDGVMADPTGRANPRKIDSDLLGVAKQIALEYCHE